MKEIIAIPEEVVSAIKSFISGATYVEAIKKCAANSSVRGTDFFTVLESLSIVVYYPIENESNNGFHTKRIVNGKSENFVFINTANDICKQTFAAAHELGHVLGVDKFIEKNTDSYDDSFKEEYINRFASEILMPEEDFRNFF